MSQAARASSQAVEFGSSEVTSPPWPAVTAALEDIGYSGWATAELRGGDAEYLRDVAARMDRCFGMA